MDDRNRVFQRLKPPCVALSQAALALNGPSGHVTAVTDRLERLKAELAPSGEHVSLLDEKLADYVFFPLSQILKVSQKVSIRCLELTFQCLAILIENGWRSRIQPQLAVQIVILCTMMAGKKPAGLASAESTDELRVSALTCLHQIFVVSESAAETKAALASEANFPQLGQTISIILEAILNSDSADVQAAGSHALQSLLEKVATRDIEASFLPGIVSTLTKVLRPQTSQRRNPAVLTGALRVLQLLFVDTLGDTVVQDLQDVPDNQVINHEWLKNAASQLKPAVASIVRLKGHSRYDVRESLARFCFDILEHCQTSLGNCGPLAIETVLSISANHNDNAVRFKLDSLAEGNSTVSTLIQSTLFDWVRSLPTQMQSADDQAKLQRLQEITTAYDVAVASRIDMASIDRSMANVLRDSVIITMQPPNPSQRKDTGVSPLQSLDLSLLETEKNVTEFSSALVKYKGQQQIMKSIENIVDSIARSSSSTDTIGSSLVRTLRQSRGDAQIATFWLLVSAIQSSLASSQAVELLDFEEEQSLGRKELLEDVFSFSLDLLSNTSDEYVDPRLLSLALRTLSLRARATGGEYRLELADALYPVLHTLATPDANLQQDSIATLNIYTSVCGYSSVKDLIVDNADYLTNAVALKLNAFDVSPQAPQVLLMMVRLAGSSLLPYLNDTIDSIFAALRDYHGYSLLVELLFKVLGVVAEEGAKHPQLAITDGRNNEVVRSIADTWTPVNMDALIDSLREHRIAEAQEPPPIQLAPHPRKPWRADETEQHDGEDGDGQDGNPLPMDVQALIPAPKVYGLMLKISELTQHFLPSASASLRLSLLALIKTSMPVIARHEDSFLPLINTLWPEIVSRLDDAESSVVSSALDVVALLCENAGDFMRSRLLQLWPTLLEIFQRTERELLSNIQRSTSKRVMSTRESLYAASSDRTLFKSAIQRLKSTPADYIDTSARLVWESLVHVILASVQHVQLSPDHFDEALEMLDPILEQSDVCAAFEAENPDAVWLARIRNGNSPLPDVMDVGLSASRKLRVTTADG